MVALLRLPFYSAPPFFPSRAMGRKPRNSMGVAPRRGGRQCDGPRPDRATPAGWTGSSSRLASVAGAGLDDEAHLGNLLASGDPFQGSHRPASWKSATVQGALAPLRSLSNSVIRDFSPIPTMRVAPGSRLFPRGPRVRPHTNPTRERGRQPTADPRARASGWCVWAAARITDRRGWRIGATAVSWAGSSRPAARASGKSPSNSA